MNNNFKQTLKASQLKTKLELTCLNKHLITKTLKILDSLKYHNIRKKNLLSFIITGNIPGKLTYFFTLSCFDQMVIY